MKKTTQERFYEKVFFSPDGCWYWTAAWTKETGYGKFSIGGRDLDSHRASYLIHKGGIPKGLCVRHTCDNKLCVNPDHLLIGTQADNIRDSIRRGRHTNGTTNGNSKLTEVQVRLMREAYIAGHSVRDIAKYFNMKDAQTYCVVTHKAWRHIL